VIEIDNVRAVVADIEGTTSSLAFVKDVLFPYARRALPAYVRNHVSELGAIAAQVESLCNRRPLGASELTEVLLQWMEEDRKVTPLKTLQGLIWRAGYESGELQSHVYEDAVRSLRQWQASGLEICIYSSGSIEAQKLLFAHTAYGDLTALLSRYFDTTTGSKLESSSYEKIAAALGIAPNAIVFLSDHPGEIHAAAVAGMQTVLLAREQTGTGVPHSAHSFDEIRIARPKLPAS
jgi:enolase-phosphatase E1